MVKLLLYFFNNFSKNIGEFTFGVGVNDDNKNKMAGITKKVKNLHSFLRITNLDVYHFFFNQITS